jgi:PEGA domain
MKQLVRGMKLFLWISLLLSALILPARMHAGNEVMAEIQFEGKSHVEKTSGVWVDGQYLGYLKELKGSKKVLLLPGEHVITVRQSGYQDFTQTIIARPGQTEILHVAMHKGVTGPMPSVTASVKIAVNPTRAAVFMDGVFVGHVGEFEGLGRAMLIAPGAHKIRIALPGYQTFETEITVIANQKLEIKTDLAKNDSSAAISDTGAATQPEQRSPTSIPPPPPPPPPQH